LCEVHPFVRSLADVAKISFMRQCSIENLPV
jgi:hypothetical protein